MGCLVVAAHRANAFPAGAELRLKDFADLIATAVANAEDRAHLQTQAATDVLTGLPNQRAFRERLDDEVARARRHGRPLTIALVDVDPFRELNDRIGLESADRVLEEVGGLLAGVVREEDVVARMGGDEYGMIFMECDRHEALIMAERVRRNVAEAGLPHHQRATVSVGVCDLESAASADELLRRAGAALYWAKEHGRDLCWVYDPRSCASSAPTSPIARPTARTPWSACARSPGRSTPRTRDPGALRARRGHGRAAGRRPGLAARPRRAAARRGAPARRGQDRHP